LALRWLGWVWMQISGLAWWQWYDLPRRNGRVDRSSTNGNAPHRRVGSLFMQSLWDVLYLSHQVIISLFSLCW